MTPTEVPEPDPWGCLMVGPSLLAAGEPGGPLAGLRFVAKDLFDVAGLPTGGGSPEWAATHPVPEQSSPAVARLLAGGADLVGKSITDELAFSLSGTNPHYGTPRNPVCPDRVPGGSSSGSAVAVAAGLCDLALGTDTGGSVRAPASWCGIVGLRTTHGRVPLTGIVPLAPSFDTVGWFGRTVEVVGRAAPVLLDQGPSGPPERADRRSVPEAPAGGRGAEAGAGNREGVDVEPSELLVADDAFALLDPATATALSPAVDAAVEAVGGRRPVALAPGPDDFAARYAAFRAIQGYEAWGVQGKWIAEVRPALGRGVGERFAYGSTVTEEQHGAADEVRARVRRHLTDLLGDDGVLCLPATAGPAARLDIAPADHAAGRIRSLLLLCTVGLVGAPCLVLPGARVEGCPVGLALVARPGGDEALLRVGARLEPHLAHLSSGDRSRAPEHLQGH